MGMFDTFHFVGANDALLCGEGHELREFQTKDLDCDMDQYYVFDGCLYYEPNGVDRAPPEYKPVFGAVEIVSTKKVLPISIGKTAVQVYTHCEHCLPVLYERTGSNSYFGDMVGEAEPWVEYELHIDGGLVTEIKPVRVETRDDVRAKHSENIPDDDRVAKRHFERIRDKK